jgi:hypothetical protein
MVAMLLLLTEGLPMATILTGLRPEGSDLVALSARKRLRPKDVRDQYGVSLTTIYTALYKGELKARRFQERIWLIEPADVEDWIERCSEPNVA